MTNLGFAAVSLDRSDLLKVLRAFRNGDFSVRMPMDLAGIDGELAVVFNDVVEMNQRLAEELARIRDEVGRKGQISQRAKLPGAAGSWADCVASVNDLIGDLVRPTAEVARVIESVVKGDLSQAMPLEMGGRPLRGEFLRIGKVVNTMVNQLGGFASKVRLLADETWQVERKKDEVEQARGALAEQAEQLALSSRYKAEFLANMSHELRTPLNSLLILAKMLAEDPGNNLTPKQVAFAHTIHAAGTDLLVLINDILDLARIESGTVTLDITQARFYDLLDYVERMFGQTAHDKGLKFTVEIGSGLSAAIETDVKRLQQILKNLLSNAFKFTHCGEVSLHIATATSGWTPGHAHLDTADGVMAFSVIDTGIGIPANKQRIIFEAFQQGDGTTSRQYGGSGLGLAISRELARLLGGEIRVSSNRGEGSTFTLYLPLSYNPRAVENRTASAIHAPEPGPSHAERADGYGGLKAEQSLRSQPAMREDPGTRGLLANPEKTIPELSGKKALIVDDDIRNLFALTGALEQHGMTVLDADNGKDGIEKLKNHPDLDIVLMDIMMPELDGYDTMRIIRRLDEFKNLPIIAVTAKAMKGDREKCIEAGASDYIAKPINMEQLLSLLRVWLTHRGNGPGENPRHAR